MKGIISAATFISLLAALVSAAPTPDAGLPKRDTIIYSKGADFIRVTSEADPTNDQTGNFGAAHLQALISRTNGQNEFASYASFSIPDISAIAGATTSSTCQFVVKQPATVTGSAIIQLFTLGAPLSNTDPVTFWQHPYHDQYRGMYGVNPQMESTALDVFTFPCQFGTTMDFVMRPENDNDAIAWTQDNANNVGAFIEISNA